MKLTNAMAQLEQWKANHQQGKINQFVNEMNQTHLGAVKNCESAKRFTKNLISPQTLVNTGVAKANCETLK